MKIKITRPDGSTVEAEGTAEECAALLGQSAAPAPVVVPYYVPSLPQPWEPWWSRRYTVDGVGWTGGTTIGAGTITVTPATTSVVTPNGTEQWAYTDGGAS